MLIEWVLLSGHFHPCKDNGTAAGDDVGQAFHFFEALGGVFIDSLDSQKINAVSLRAFPRSAAILPM